MAENTKLDPLTTAVLAMDLQNGIVGMVEGAQSIFGAVGRVFESVRARKIRLIHVGIGFREGYPEVHPGHTMFGMIRQTGRFINGTESAEFFAAARPLASEITVVKHRVSAFSGNDLEMILRAQNISTLVLLGISTSGIVLSTLRQASDLDYRCIVIKDCCFERDEEVHRVLTEKVLVRQATVVNAETFVKDFIS